MKISELQTLLEEAKSKHGDISVCYEGDGLYDVGGYEFDYIKELDNHYSNSNKPQDTIFIILRP